METIIEERAQSQEHVKRSFEEFSGLLTLTSEGWRRYRVWNAALNDYFFSGTFAFQPVYLDVDEKAMRAIHGANLVGQVR